LSIYYKNPVVSLVYTLERRFHIKPDGGFLRSSGNQYAPKRGRLKEKKDFFF